ncbi:MULTISPECIES: ATP-binding protein [unclassified Spirosoma]|uniref:ATP-binding protein n=1 Tax=unclassified Spirosoma TaxID=2621999 RepID=UPI0009614A69|nr:MULTISPECIES: ATP-binding protein [unclassified Spirosoma]MBN8822453.1 tetratricopeptide repeat protein [Spirosoma sp.]OJW73965.1 MAG: hypothetical protein BGO59_12535 [Spirosoma sp. 48-14]
MKKPEALQLQRISVFMPQRLRDDEIERLFIMRQDVFHTLLDSIKTEKETSIPQHHLIIGQRGMGKTTLLKRLDVELRKAPLSKKFVPFTFPEEQYNIDRLSKFWLNSLDALADTLQTEGDEKMAFQLDEQIAALSTIRNEQELSRKAYESLRNLTKSLGRRPVFLLDNLNLIFDRLGEVEQSKLRKLITEPGAPIFIGASPEAFDEDLQYDAPFYDAFAVHFLYKLDFQQTLVMLRHLAEITNQTTLLSQLTAENMPRLETLHALTGGNVRTVVILFSLVAQGFSADVFQDLEALIDQMTPLYKSRFEELAPQAQVVVDAVALNWNPCKLDTLRERTSLENNQLSIQLDRLGKSGWISKLGKRKAASYEISERFFNIWYLMRRATRRQRRDLLWLTRFLQAWFTRPELVKHAKAFMRNVHEREEVYELAYGLALARALPNQTGEQLKEKIYQRLLQLVDGDVDKLEELVGVNMDEVSEEIIKKYNINKSYQIYLDAWLNDDKTSVEETERLLRDAIELDSNNSKAWSRLARLLEESNRKAEAEKSYKVALSIDPTDYFDWINLGEILEERGELAEAEEAFSNATNIDKSAWSWRELGDFLERRKRYTEAERAYNKSLSINKDAEILAKIADLLAYRLSRESEAEALYKESVDMTSKNVWDYMPRIRYGWYLQHKGKLHDAELQFKTLTKTKAKTPPPHIFYAYSRFLMECGRPLEAESMMIKATQTKLGQTLGWVWEGMGDIYLSLNKMKESEEKYLKAISLSKGDIKVEEKLLILYRDKLGESLRGNQLFYKIKEHLSEERRLLHKASFEEYNHAWSLASAYWITAIQNLEKEPNKATREIFHLSAAVAIRLGYGEQLQNIFRETGHDQISRPFYEAIKALTLNSEEYLKTEVAAEVREVALKIFKFMQDYNTPVAQ